MVVEGELERDKIIHGMEREAVIPFSQYWNQESSNEDDWWEI